MHLFSKSNFRLEQRSVKKSWCNSTHLLLGLLGSLLDPPGGSLFGGGVGVEFEHGSDVGERVLLGGPLGGVAALGRVEYGLHFVALEHGLEVGVLDDGGWDAPVLLGAGTGGEATVDGVEGFEGVFGEDEESADVSTWRESENVQAVDIEDLDAWDVSEGSDDTVVLSVDESWSQLLDVLSVSALASAGSHPSAGVNSLDIVPSAQLLEQINGLLGLLVVLSAVADNQWDLWHLIDSVALGHHQGWHTGGGNSAGNGVSSLVDVTLLVPSPPGLEWSEHPTASAHVTESGLAGSVGSATSHSWDSSDGSTGTPGLGRGLLAGDLLDSGGLSGVLSEVGVHEVDEVRSDWSLEDGWGVYLAGGISLFVVDGDLWSRCGEGHFIDDWSLFCSHCKFDLRL